MVKRLFKYTLILLFIFTTDAYTQEGTSANIPEITYYVVEGGTKTLTLNDFVVQSGRNDITFREILIDEWEAKYKKHLTLPIDDWLLSIQSQYNTVIEGSSKSGPEARIALNKLFSNKGTELSAGYSTSVSASTSDNVSSFDMLVSQPIAENAFGKVNKYLEIITGYEEKVAHYQIIEAYEDYLATLIKLYYNWYFAYKNLETAQNSYVENLKQLDNMIERKKNNIALDIDVNKIRLQVLAKKERVIAISDDFDKKLALIKQSAGIDFKENVTPEENPGFFKELKLPFDKGYKEFRKDSRTSKILQLLKDKTDIELSKEANGLLPSANIDLGYSTSGSGLNISDPEYTVSAGFSLEFPFTSQSEKAKHEIAKANQRKTDISTNNRHIHLHTDLLNLYEQIEKTKKLIANAQERIDLSKSILNDEQRNYTLGQATLNELITAVNNLENNEFNRIAHSVKLKLLVIEWFRLTDRLVTKIENTEVH